MHVLFDSGATHSFVIPEVVSSFKGTFTRVKVGVSVRTPGNHNLRADSCVLGIPIYVGSTVYPADLLVVSLGQTRSNFGHGLAVEILRTVGLWSRKNYT